MTVTVNELRPNAIQYARLRSEAEMAVKKKMQEEAVAEDCPEPSNPNGATPPVNHNLIAFPLISIFK